MLSRIIYSALRVTGITALARNVSSGGVILCYHNIVTGGEVIGDPAIHLPLAMFERQVRWFAACYDVVPLREFVERMQSARSMRRVAAVTFDDAYEGVFTHGVPLLHRMKLPATVFIPTNFIEKRSAFWWDDPVIAGRATPERRQRWLQQLHGDGDEIATVEGAASSPGLPSSHRPAGWETIRLAAHDGLDLGVHSASHRNMPLLSDADLRQEIYVSRATLERNTGVRATSFAYPYGLWDRRTRDLVKAAGFESALTLDDGLNDSAGDPWALRRVNIPASISAPAFQAWAAGLRPNRPVA